jgi:cytochrome c
LPGWRRAGGKPNLGKTASPEEIASWDISIGPDGAGLPSGSGTPQQGEQVYLTNALGVTARKAQGKPNDQLVGGQGSLGPGQVPVKTVGSFWPYATTLFDYVRRAMPLNESKSLRDEEVYAVVAYLLLLNGVIAESDTIDAQTFACSANAESRWICPFFPERNDFRLSAWLLLRGKSRTSPCSITRFRYALRRADISQRDRHVCRGPIVLQKSVETGREA